ncbi:MAG: hypothetical protein IIT58_11510 [Treponema sp.]|nr:hypothetical protein [Treponema sp.]
MKKTLSLIVASFAIALSALSLTGCPGTYAQNLYTHDQLIPLLEKNYGGTFTWLAPAIPDYGLNVYYSSLLYENSNARTYYFESSKLKEQNINNGIVTVCTTSDGKRSNYYGNLYVCNKSNYNFLEKKSELLTEFEKNVNDYLEEKGITSVEKSLVLADYFNYIELPNSSVELYYIPRLILVNQSAYTNSTDKKLTDLAKALKSYTETEYHCNVIFYNSESAEDTIEKVLAAHSFEYLYCSDYILDETLKAKITMF